MKSRYRVVVSAGLAACIAFGAGCGRTTSNGNPDMTGGRAGAGSGQGGGPSQGAAAGMGGADLDCGSPSVAAAPLRRLTRFEYRNTVRDLFAPQSPPADALPADNPSDGAATQDVTRPVVDEYHRVAHELALQATQDPDELTRLAGCDPGSEGEEACAARVIEELVPRLLRRALEPDDAADFGQVFATGRELGGGFAGGVRAVLEVALQSPEFLYRVELGEPDAAAPAGLERPSAYEMASRLSYLFWGSLPDTELWDAAVRDELRSSEAIERQARRMIEDPRAHEQVRRFYFQLAGLEDRDFSELVAGRSPALTPEIAELLLEETRHFVDDVTFQDPGDFRTLLLTPFTWVNGPLAAFYGIDGIDGSNFQKVGLEDARRGGLLTQGSLMAATAHRVRTRPVQRGYLVTRKFLCLEVPPHPVGLGPEPEPAEPELTTRQLSERHVRDPACAACHRLLDPIGFAFEHFDATGVWRDSENGQPIDATGAISGTDAEGAFDGAMELARLLSESDDVRACYVQNWMAFAYGREAAAEDTCTRQFLLDRFQSARENVLELLIALTQSDAFLYRRDF